MNEELKKSLIFIAVFLVLVLLAQYIRYKYFENKVREALMDPTLQEKYKEYTKDGFHRFDFPDAAKSFNTSAIVSVWPFSIELTKRNTSDDIYWNDVKEGEDKAVEQVQNAPFGDPNQGIAALQYEIEKQRHKRIMTLTALVFIAILTILGYNIYKINT